MTQAEAHQLLRDAIDPSVPAPPPVVIAIHVSGRRWVLDGFAPWVTDGYGCGRVYALHDLVTGARLEVGAAWFAWSFRRVRVV